MLHDLTALEQAAAVRTGEISPAELTAHYLARIDRLNAAFGAFVTVTAERATVLASGASRAASAARADGTAGGLPSLFGVPTAIKDLTPTAGVRTTFGSRAFGSYVPGVDAHAVTLLRTAGTISLGKTNTPEFGLCAYTDNDVAGPARSPWDPGRSAGGSSGGAAAAVAAGLVPVAHGSDGGGSLRIPGSACGLVGLKPSRGRVSSGPDGADASGLSVQGPVARTVRDAAALLDALAVPMPGDPYGAPPLPPGESFAGHAERDPGRLRIGRYATPPSRSPVHPDCLAAWEAASRLLAGLGHEVEDIDVPAGPETVGYFATVWAVMSLDTRLDAAQEELLRPVARAWREHGRAVSGADYAAAITGMQLAARRSVVATAPFDAVLTPTLALPPQPHEYFAEDDPRQTMRRQAAFSPFTPLYNMTGQPAVSLPLYWTADTVPIGVSLAGRPAGEAQLIELAAQLEAACPWSGRHPACW